jgi:hypothetical protein
LTVVLLLMNLSIKCSNHTEIEGLRCEYSMLLNEELVLSRTFVTVFLLALF